MKTLLEATNLNRYYGDYHAVKDVSIALAAGDIVGLLGLNGAGKTTTMEMLTGNLAPSSGAVAVKGVSLLDAPKTAKRFIGYLPERPPLYRDLTVDEYLAFCARLRRLRGAEVGRAVAQAREQTGLAQSGRRLIGNLSKGYQQRVGIAQAIIHAPDVIILDEPTAGLDPIQIREIRELIRRLGERSSVILSTHILAEAQAVCHRVYILHAGRIAYDDADAGKTDAQLVAGFETQADLDAIGQLDGVTKVAQTAPHRYTITHTRGRNPAAALARLAVERGWGLLEMTPAAPGLEQVFIDITQGNVTHGNLTQDNINHSRQAA